MTHAWFVLADLLGTFAFALSGAAASIERRLDLFGVAVVAFVTACGGGMLRDLCLGATPPAALVQPRYVAVAVLACAMSLGSQRLIRRLRHPVLVFDAVGLGFFAVVGAHKVLLATHDVEAAVLLGAVTAVGGGVVRDVLLNRVPVILQREIYALAALLGAGVQVAGQRAGWAPQWTPVLGVLSCALLRFLAMRRGWSLPLSRGVDGGRAE
jgi:uncharacterized membrane protein YeiH